MAREATELTKRGFAELSARAEEIIRKNQETTLQQVREYQSKNSQLEASVSEAREEVRQAVRISKESINLA